MCYELTCSTKNNVFVTNVKITDFIVILLYGITEFHFYM